MALDLPDSPQSPFFVSSTDLQVTSIVSPELTEGNYPSWKRSVELALSIRNKLGFVDGTIEKPAVSSPLCHAWVRCDSLVKAWLQKSVSIPIATTIFYFSTAKEVWDELKERYGEPDVSKICQLQFQYHALTQGSKTISGFYNEMLSLLRELKVYRPMPCCECGKCECGWQKKYMEEQQTDMVFKFLNGLSREYEGLRTQLLLRKPFPTLGEAYNVVQREELQKTVRNEASSLFEHPVAATVVAQAERTTEKVLDTSQVNYAERKRFNPDIICDNCGKKGHIKRECYFLVGFPPSGTRGGRGRGRNSVRYQGREGRRTINLMKSGEEISEGQLPQLNLTGNQIQKLLSLLSVEDNKMPNAPASYRQTSQLSTPSASTTSAPSSSFSGLTQLDDDWSC